MDPEIFTEVDHYISSLLGVEDDILKNVNHSLRALNLPVESISSNQGKFLQVMAFACNAKNILEIGTLGAYSTIWLARTLPENGKLISIEVDAGRAELAKENIFKAGLNSIVEIKTGKASDILPQIQQEMNAPFDLVFIDADKPNYTLYFDWSIKLGRKGTIIIADNVIREGKILDADSQDEKVTGVQYFNKSLAENNKVTATILQNVGVKTHDGMAIAVVK